MTMRTIPKHLAAPTKKWVKSVIDDYELQDHQFTILILAAETRDRSELARREVLKNGITFRDKFDQIKTNPACTIERDSKDLFRRLLRELNLSENVDDTRPPALKFGGK